MRALIDKVATTERFRGSRNEQVQDGGHWRQLETLITRKLQDRHVGYFYTELERIKDNWRRVETGGGSWRQLETIPKLFRSIEKEKLRHGYAQNPGLYASPDSCFFRISPAGAGIFAPSGTLLRALKSSHICSIVTHSTPSCLLMCSMILGTLVLSRV